MPNAYVTLHDYATRVYSHAVNVSTSPETPAAPATGRDRRPASGQRIRVGIVGATGYVGGELIRLLSRHPDVEIVGPPGPRPRRRADRSDAPAPRGTGLTSIERSPRADAVFLALPHGAAAELVPDLVAAGADDHRPRARTSGSAIRPTTRAGTASSIRARRCSATPSTACRSCIGAELVAARATPTVRDRRRAGLLPDHDAPRARPARPRRAHRRPRRGRQERRVGRRPRAEGRPDVRRGQREREGVRHRRPPPRRRDRAGAGRLTRRAARRAEPGRRGVDFLPHLIPMTRGILSACHVRPTRADRARPSSTSCTRRLRRRAVRDGRRRAARDQARHSAATTSGSTSTTTSGPAGSWRSA